MDAIPTCGREAGNHRRLGRVRSRILTAIFTLFEIVLVGLVIASLIAIATVSHVASSLPASHFNAPADPHTDRMI